MSLYLGHGLYGPPPMLGCRIFATANQSIPSVTQTAITFGSETYDFGALHSPSTNPTRITFPRSGWVIAGGTIDMAVPTATIIQVLSILLNGATALGGHSQLDVTTSGNILTVVTGFRAARNDYIELFFIHTNAVAINSVASGVIPNFWAHLWPD